MGKNWTPPVSLLMQFYDKATDYICISTNAIPTEMRLGEGGGRAHRLRSRYCIICESMRRRRRRVLHIILTDGVNGAVGPQYFRYVIRFHRRPELNRHIHWVRTRPVWREMLILRLYPGRAAPLQTTTDAARHLRLPEPTGRIRSRPRGLRCMRIPVWAI